LGCWSGRPRSTPTTAVIKAIQSSLYQAFINFKNMKKYIFLILSIFSCSSDEPKIILYEFDDICVTRIDHDTESYFYFGKFKNGDILPTSYVKSEFSGLNSGMDAYLIFNKIDVEVYYSMDYFKNVGAMNKIKVINKPDSRTFNYNFDDKVRGKYNNVCRISNILERERELNTKNHSNVKITYP
jgi:hypothetical protein